MPDFTTKDLRTYTPYANGSIHGNDPLALLDTDVTTIWSSITNETHGSAGFVIFSATRVIVSGVGNVQIKLQRVAGFAGAISVNVSTYSTTGAIAMTAGSHFTAVTNKTVSWSDGEVAEKSFNVVITNAPAAGLHLFGLSMSNPVGGVVIRNPDMHIYFDNGGVNEAATLVDATVSSDLETTINAVSAGDLVYVRSGTYTYNNLQAGQSWGGYTISNTSGTKTAPIVVRNYPGEFPLIDQQFLGTPGGGGNNVTTGLFLINSVSYMFIGGIEIINTKYSGVQFGTTGQFVGCVIEDMHVHDIAKNSIANYDLPSHADNIGGVRIDNTLNVIVRNNTIHNIYNPKDTSNYYDANPYGLQAGVHGYLVEDATIESNTIFVVYYAVYSKRAIQALGGANGNVVRRNKFSELENCGILLGVSGSGDEPMHNTIIAENSIVLDAASGNDVGLVRVFYRGDVASQPDGLFIFNNTQVGGDSLFDSKTMEGIVAYDNVLIDARYNLSIEDDSLFLYNNQIDYCDYNCFYNISIGGFTTERSGASTSYATLALWQGAFAGGDPQLNRDVGGNSIETQPTFVNAATGDYRTVTGVTEGAGRFGRHIGIGLTVVGAT